MVTIAQQVTHVKRPRPLMIYIQATKPRAGVRAIRHVLALCIVACFAHGPLGQIRVNLSEVQP